MSTNKPPILVVLQLGGGNDVLNTVIPYADSRYYDSRKHVRIPEEDVLKIDDHFGFHPSMAALKPFWDQAKLAIINGIGYPRSESTRLNSSHIQKSRMPSSA